MSRTTTAAFVILLSCFLTVFAAGALSAETIMIAVQETVDGTAGEPPLPTVEGVSKALYEVGHIVFDAGSVAWTARADELAKIARDGQAEWLLRITVSYIQTKLDQKVARVTCSATYSLISLETGGSVLTDRLTISNTGREKTTDRMALGVELGELISKKVVERLPSPTF